MSENEEPTKEKPVRKRGSLVWQYFEKLSSVRVKCRICQHEQRYMGNTANSLRHLKAKHDIDARAVGLSDPENVKRMKSLTPFGVPFEPAIAPMNIKNECNFFEENDQNNEDVEKESDDEDEPTMKRSTRSRLHQEDNEAEIDPYGNNEEPLVDFVDTNNHYSDEDEPFHRKRSSRSNPNRKTSSLEDERMRAEIEYFREKAEYFRIQKHLTALQAKKVKFELEQLYGK